MNVKSVITRLPSKGEPGEMMHSPSERNLRRAGTFFSVSTPRASYGVKPRVSPIRTCIWMGGSQTTLMVGWMGSPARRRVDRYIAFHRSLNCIPFHSIPLRTVLMGSPGVEWTGTLHSIPFHYAPC